MPGEHQSLNAIYNAIPSLCPKSHAHDSLNSGGYFLATDFLDLSRYSSTARTSSLSLAQKLVQLHTALTPIPEGYEKPQFGFPVPTCCGDTEQDNSFRDNWADFYANNRLRHILKKGERNHGSDAELRKLVEKTASSVVPRLLRNGHLKSASTSEDVIPVVVHGDLWSGNHGKGSIEGGPIEEVVYDPSCSWSHNEFEFGIMKMFGGFGNSFEKEYFAEKEKLGQGGKDEPVDEWDDRVQLYELWVQFISNLGAIFTIYLPSILILGGGFEKGAVVKRKTD